MRNITVAVSLLFGVLGTSCYADDCDDDSDACNDFVTPGGSNNKWEITRVCPPLHNYWPEGHHEDYGLPHVTVGGQYRIERFADGAFKFTELDNFVRGYGLSSKAIAKLWQAKWASEPFTYHGGTGKETRLTDFQCPVSGSGDYLQATVTLKHRNAGKVPKPVDHLVCVYLVGTDGTWKPLIMFDHPGGNLASCEPQAATSNSLYLADVPHRGAIH